MDDPLQLAARLRAPGRSTSTIAGRPTTSSCSASAPARPPRHRARQERMPQGIPLLTATGLVMRLLGPNRTTGSTGNCRDRQDPAARHRRTRLRCPSTRTAAGSCSVITSAYETEHHLHTNIGFSGWGQDLRRPQHGRRDHRPHRPPRTDDPLRGRIGARPPSCNNQCNNQQPAGPANAETA